MVFTPYQLNFTCHNQKTNIYKLHYLKILAFILPSAITSVSCSCACCKLFPIIWHRLNLAIQIYEPIIQRFFFKMVLYLLDLVIYQYPNNFRSRSCTNIYLENSQKKKDSGKEEKEKKDDRNEKEIAHQEEKKEMETKDKPKIFLKKMVVFIDILILLHRTVNILWFYYI